MNDSFGFTDNLGTSTSNILDNSLKTESSILDNKPIIATGVKKRSKAIIHIPIPTETKNVRITPY